MGAVTTGKTTVKENTETEEITYEVEEKSLEYTIIGDNIKADFNFLKKEIPDKLNEMLKELKVATDENQAFYFESSAKYSDLIHVYNEIEEDTKNLKNELKTLYDAFMKDIDNVNAELDYNFGHWLFGSVNEAGRVAKTTNDK